MSLEIVFLIIAYFACVIDSRRLWSPSCTTSFRLLHSIGMCQDAADQSMQKLAGTSAANEIGPHTQPMKKPKDSTSQDRHQRFVQALKRFNQLEAMASRGDPEGCRIALEELAAIEESGSAFEFGPNAYNRAMRVCATDHDKVEEIYATIAATGQHDTASLEALALARLDNDMLVEAAAAVAQLLAKMLEPRINKSGRKLPLKKVPERTVRVVRAVLDTCIEAGLNEGQLSGAPQLWERLGELQLYSPLTPPKLERTLALLKPDCLKAGVEQDVERLIRAQGFIVVERKRWRMNPAEAAAFLSTSWGSNAGDRKRRFFSEMVDFYCSGDVIALLLETEGAIAKWRQLLGPGDPAAARGYTDRFGRVHRAKAPQSVRAQWGLNKQANVAHGSDSRDAAIREIGFVFGEDWNEILK